MDKNGYKSVFAEKRFKAGETIFELEGTYCFQPTKYTIQLGEREHLEPFLENNNDWKFVNHSCCPNAYIDTIKKKMKALVEIRPSEEICFDYNRTEFDMSAPFQCHCRSATCYDVIGGFQSLTLAQQKHLLKFSSPHIQALAKTLYQFS